MKRLQINVISSFIYGTHAVEESLSRAFGNLGHHCIINGYFPKADFTLVVHASHTWKVHETPGIKILYHPDEADEDAVKCFDQYDLVFLAHDSSLIDDKKIFYLPLAYDSEINNSMEFFDKYVGNKDIDVIFVGTWYPERDFMKKIPRIQLSGHGWKKWFIDEINKWISEYDSKIGINFVRPDTTDNNIRLYELCALGTFQLTNKTNKDLVDGRDLVVFRDEEDLKQKIDYYLTHSEEREKIAKQGQQTVKPFTYEYRAKEMVKIIEDNILSKRQD